MRGFEHKFFNVALRFHWVTCPLECSDMTELLVIALGFAFWGLVLGTEVCAAAFFTCKSVLTHCHAQLEEVVNTASLLESSGSSTHLCQ
jgi:hypothetical protein